MDRKIYKAMYYMYVERTEALAARAPGRVAEFRAKYAGPGSGLFVGEPDTKGGGMIVFNVYSSTGETIWALPEKFVPYRRTRGRGKEITESEILTWPAERARKEAIMALNAIA